MTAKKFLFCGVKIRNIFGFNCFYSLIIEKPSIYSLNMIKIFWPYTEWIQWYQTVLHFSINNNIYVCTYSQVGKNPKGISYGHPI